MPYFRAALEILEQQPGVDLYTRSEVYRHIGFYYLVEASDPSAAISHLQVSHSSFARDSATPAGYRADWLLSLRASGLPATGTERSNSWSKRSAKRAPRS
jgi:hypothetical protein